MYLENYKEIIGCDVENRSPVQYTLGKEYWHCLVLPITGPSLGVGIVLYLFISGIIECTGSDLIIIGSSPFIYSTKDTNVHVR